MGESSDEKRRERRWFAELNDLHDLWENVHERANDEAGHCKALNLEYDVMKAPGEPDWSAIKDQADWLLRLYTHERRAFLNDTRDGGDRWRRRHSVLRRHKIPQSFIMRRAHTLLSLYQTGQPGRAHPVPFAIIRLMGIGVGAHRYNDAKGKRIHKNVQVLTVRLAIEENPDSSDREIARRAHLSPKQVRNLRERGSLPPLK